MAVKKSIESKVSDTTSRGAETSNTIGKKRSGTLGGTYGLDLQIPARALIPDDVTYKVAADLGLAPQVDEGGIDVTAQQILDQSAKSGARGCIGHR